MACGDTQGQHGFSTPMNPPDGYARDYYAFALPFDGMASITQSGWARWCSRFDALRDEVLGLHHSRRVWRAVRVMIETNPDVHRSGIAEHWLTECYSVAQLSAVRRQVDRRKDVVSLWRLLDELARKPTMATRSWFAAELQSRPESAPYATRLSAEFDTFAGTGASTVDKRTAEADRDRLWTAAEAAKLVVDQSVAHQTDVTGAARPGTALITWGELDTAIDTVGELYKKYYRLRHPGQVLGNLEPDLPAGWDRIFESAWRASPDGSIPLQ